MNFLINHSQGYRKKPWLISVFTCVYLLLPLFSIPALIEGSSGFGGWIRQLAGSPAFLNEAVCAWLAAAALYSVTRPGFYLFILLSFYMMSLKFSSLGETSVAAAWTDLALMAIWLWITCALVLTTMRIPYLRPKSRWWRQPGRYITVMRGVLIHQNIHFPIVVLNVCRTGVFVKLDERLMALSKKLKQPGVQGPLPDPFKEERRKIQQEDNPLISPLDIESARNHIMAYPDSTGQEVLLQVAIRPEKNMGMPWEYMTIRATVVWISKPGSEQAYGAGLQFQQISGTQQKIWGNYLKRLNQRKDTKVRP